MPRELVPQLTRQRELEAKAKAYYINYLKQINAGLKATSIPGGDPRLFFNYQKIFREFNRLFPLIARQEEHHTKLCNEMLKAIQANNKKNKKIKRVKQSRI